MSPTRATRNFINKLGLAWWAKVETLDPSVTYWFGPFVTKKSLSVNLEKFLDDLLKEGASSLTHTLVRTRRGEPLTT